MLNLDDIQSARQRIQGRVKRTPLVTSQALSDRLGAKVYLKLELFQKTGSFKVRGAFNKVLSLPEDRRGRGLVAVSGGNHAQAVAYAAKELGLRSVIVMPEKTPRNYVDATRGYGAEVVLVPRVQEAFREIAKYENDGWISVHPFDDPLVMAGQGTVGVEIVEDLPDVTDVLVSIGGGGFI
ncbi:MAG: pyridoxal-phosphate dependent enzyme, partial [Bryobacteraceae bacterium]